MTASWAAHLRRATTTAEVAVRALRTGQTIVVGGSNAEPHALVGALVQQADRIAGMRVLMWPGGFPTPLADPALAQRITLRLNVPNAGTKASIAAGQAEYVPGNVYRSLQLLRSGRPHLDAALVTVAPPDDKGYCSLGTSVVNLGVACQVADSIIAEVNDQMPRTCGEGRIHVTDIDAFVEVSRPLPELAPGKHGMTAAVIAAHVASIVRDGSTIECGIGALPNAVMEALHGHRDLAVHTGIVGDSLIELVGSGALRSPGLDIGPVVCAGSVLGTQRLYDFVDENPIVQMRTGLVTHDPAAMGSHHRFVAINSAIEIDLSGQVNSESISGSLVAGVGGQNDFARGARLSPEGQNILVLASTASGGGISRIVPTLGAGVPVAMSRADVQWVVTEHGKVNLEGLTLAERGEALVSIADPAHRAVLAAA